MKTAHSLLLCSLLLPIAATRPSSRAQSETDTPPLRVGVYDSRAVAVAYGGSPCMRDKMSKLQDQLKAAKQAGSEDEIARLEKEGKAWQAKLHRQAFNAAPVDDLLECIADTLPKLKQEAQVAHLLSKWNKTELDKHPNAKRIDLTMKLVDAFHPDPKQRKYAEEIQKKPPISLD